VAQQCAAGCFCPKAFECSLSDAVECE
jgi:hypothetical protein